MSFFANTRCINTLKQLKQLKANQANVPLCTEYLKPDLSDRYAFFLIDTLFKAVLVFIVLTSLEKMLQSFQCLKKCPSMPIQQRRLGATDTIHLNVYQQFWEHLFLCETRPMNGLIVRR